MIANFNIPKAMGFLFEKSRYKILYGGRSSGKSESVGRYLLAKGAEGKGRIILCAREYQSSIRDSVHSMLEYLIDAHGLRSLYEVRKSEIIGINGTKFLFSGLRKNIENIKSVPNIMHCWVEEGETVSNYSWETLIPTIRADDSEIIVTFNPLLPTSATFKRFVINPPKDSIVKHVTYRDNPFFPKVMEKERLELQATDMAAYKNVWEGECRSAVIGAVFASQIAQAEQDNRLTVVPYDKSVPVNTYWDLGKQAMTAIWFIQYVGMQWRVLHMYKAHLQEVSHFINYIQRLPYNYGVHYLPHDADHERLGMHKSITSQVKATLKNVTVVPRVIKKSTALDAAQAIFSQCWFNMEGEYNCEDGMNDLRLYAYTMTEDSISREPAKTGYERDVADAWMTFAMAGKPVKKKKKQQRRSVPGWQRQVGIR